MLAAVALLAGALALAVSRLRRGRTSPPAPKRLSIVAHEDDDLIFQNPALLEAIADGDCVRTVYVTAGDAGKAKRYWHEREQGPRAAHAQMAGVADSWTNSTPASPATPSTSRP